MMGTRAPSAPAEAVRAISALRCCSLRRGGTGLGSLHGLSLAVHVGAVILTIGARLLRSMCAIRGWAALRLWRWLRLRNKQLQKENESEQHDRKGTFHDASIWGVRPVYAHDLVNRSMSVMGIYQQLSSSTNGRAFVDKRHHVLS
jgi:hypothetical protein